MRKICNFGIEKALIFYFYKNGSLESCRMPFVLDGVLAAGKSDPYKEPERWIDECLSDIAENKASAIMNDRAFVPVCVEYGITGCIMSIKFWAQRSIGRTGNGITVL